LVLVIEDDKEIRDLVEERLLDGGYRVSTAIHGAEALERVQQQPPDLILLDMDVPVMDGRAFVRVYEDSPGPHALIIVSAAIGADGESTQRGTARDRSKPFDLEPLSRLVQRVLPIHGQVTHQTPGR
jgi:two-component system response regulator (stage 0 sporulation protein F)